MRKIFVLRICQTLCVLLFVFLLTHSDIVLSYARKGLSVWAFSIVPVMLPFIILSKFWIFYDIPQLIYRIFLKILPGHSETTLAITMLLLGLCSGFPVGAVFVKHFYESNALSKKSAEQMLPLCSFVSPMFLMGYVQTMTNYQGVEWIVLMISLYLPLLLFFANGIINGGIKIRPPATYDSLSPQKRKKTSRESSVHEVWFSSLEVIFTIGIYMMLFSILSGLLTHEPMFQNTGMKVLLSNLEITTGIERLSSMPALTEPVRSMVITASISMGGICTMAQIYSILSDTCLSMRPYMLIKGKCALCSALIILILRQIH